MFNVTTLKPEMISHKYKLIFIHIPKCAGTSIEKAFGHFGLFEGRDRQDHRALREIEPMSIQCLRNSENVKEWAKRYLRWCKENNNPNNSIKINSKQFSQYYKFGLVRNPWSRAFSWYRNVISDELWRQRYKINKEISLYDFLKKFIGQDGLRSQLFWLKNFKGEIGVDKIGRFENLNEEFISLCDAVGADGISLPHELGGESDSYLNHYDEKSKRLIFTYYSDEIKLFNYKFGV